MAISSINAIFLPRSLAIPIGLSRTITDHFSLGRSPRFTSSSILQCNAISTVDKEGYNDDIQQGFLEHILDDGTEKELVSEKIRELVRVIRSMLQSMEDGEISVSAYDTAWVAMVEDGGQPRFPTSLDWISNNQLPDGSWGDREVFLVHDRMINTLACVVALKSWNMHPDKCNKGVSFIRENIWKLDDENEEHMPNGFEVVFPSLIEKAKNLKIDIPDDTQGLKNIYAKRELKFAKIPMDILHRVPTTLLFSLEGLKEGLDWDKLLKLQAADGSFLYSPASTAFALNQTKDQNCHKYLLNLVRKFNGGVPNVYPVDLFEHNWAVDRLQRLGISRYFKPEINECLDYSYRYWSNVKGMYSARNGQIQDVDDTAMGFRLLRLHGYDVSPQGFMQFEKDGEFYCFAGQSSQAVTGMYNLYRASEVMFPQEKLLQDAKKFSTKFLQLKRAQNKLIDKWIITKDLPGEVGYALDIPWYASLPRVEARFFIEQYGGEDDVWIGKTLYRMGYVNNNNYLELAKLDYNACQALHQHEWTNIQQWYENCNLGELGLSKRSLLLAYYIAAASVFEPEKSTKRLAWAKTTILMKTIESQQLSREQKSDFVTEFKGFKNARFKSRSGLATTLIKTLNKLSMDALLTHDRDIHQQLYHAWAKWLSAWEQGIDGETELLVRTLNLCDGVDESLFTDPKYEQLLEAIIKVSNHLRLFHDVKGQESDEIESSMQEVVKLVLTKSSPDIDSGVKQNFLTIAKSFYYSVHCDPATVDFHITKVLFERVV